MSSDEILDQLEIMFPEAHCELIHESTFQLLIAVILSAQTTDASVNKVTPALFEKYPTANELARADLKDVENIIRNIGLYRNKAKNIIACAKELVENYDGEVPSNMKQLTSLSGVGRKTANGVMSVAFDIPAIAVDTHVERISKRLGFAKQQDSVLQVEVKLKRKLNRQRWNRAHHLFIFFGRYFCTAKNPKCSECPFIENCREKNKNPGHHKS
ncbi:endonuclease III [Traorella massiliensis]|uniref:endonuclease III n=1 Tax=Traorella massiliensis TaxID=1903263 RepID=UPI00248D7061|nr:endonuclease III [Traorella massiliensis]